MPFHLHPLMFGVMLVVAAGTLAYTLWNSNREQEPPHGNQRHRSQEKTYSFATNDYASSGSSYVDDEGARKRKQVQERCSICLGSLKTHLKMLSCTHMFHDNCITKWLVNNTTCPNCRTAVQS